MLVLEWPGGSDRLGANAPQALDFGVEARQL
jgi:hypothetical protein